MQLSQMRIRIVLLAVICLVVWHSPCKNLSAGPILLDGSENGRESASFGQNQLSAIDFLVKNDNLAITALGFWDFGSDGLPFSFQVGFWDTSSQSLLASAVIDSSDPLDSSVVVEGGSWRYETLATPVLLTKGSTYTLGFNTGPSFSTRSQDSLYLGFVPVSPSLPIDPPVFDSNIEYVGIRSGSGVSGLQFPTSSSTTATAIRGNANAMISEASVVPEPASIALWGLGTLGMGVIVRRRKRKHMKLTA